MLKFGMIPAKLFNKPQEKLGMQNSSNQYEDESNLFLKKQEKIKNVINNYIQKDIITFRPSEVFYICLDFYLECILSLTYHQSRI